MAAAAILKLAFLAITHRPIAVLVCDFRRAWNTACRDSADDVGNDDDDVYDDVVARMMLYCRPTVALSRYTVLLGSHSSSGSDMNRVSRSVKLARNHPRYDAHYSGYDISVLTLTEAVPYNDYIRPVCLVSPYDLLTSSLICYSTGWGLTSYNNSQCRAFYLIFTCQALFPLSPYNTPSRFLRYLKIHLFKKSFPP